MTNSQPRPNPRAETPVVSLLIPVFNEEDAIDSFFAELEATLGTLQLELVFVNDGSGDTTLHRLLSRTQSDPRLRVVNLSRNFGKEAALTAGLDHVSGDVVVPMDIDLQDPPELIHDFLAKWREGHDIVYGVRVERSTDSLRKRTSALWFYRLFNRMSRDPIPENTGDFRLMDRRVVDALRRLPERSRFMKGLFAWVGFPATPVEYARPSRSAGETKFNFLKLWRLALDGLFSFSSVPLKVWSYVGAGIAGLSALYAFWIIGRTLIVGADTPGWASLITVVLFLGGLQLLSLGILGEYIARIYIEVKERPIYIVEGVYGEQQAKDETPPC